MATKIQIRRDTLSNWNLYDPILSSGEIAFVTDENKFKVGNGSSTFTALPYLQADAFIDSVELGADTTGDYVKQIEGTLDQISVSSSGGESASVVLSLPQNISTTSTPTFLGATLGGTQIGVSSSTTVDTVSGDLVLSSESGAISLEGDTTVDGNLQVEGSFVISGSTELNNKNITLGAIEAPTDVTADGGGIVLKGTTDKNFLWEDTTDSWTSSEHIDLASGKVIKFNGSEVLSSTEYTGNSATSTKLSTARTINLGGDVSGSASFDGSASVTINATVLDDSHNHVISNVDNLQDSLDAKAPLASPTFTGTVVLPSTTSIGNVSSTEIGHLDGVTSAIQTQINTKSPLESPSFTGTVTLPSTTSIGTVSSTEIGHLDGVTSSIQTQINSKANLDSPTFTGIPLSTTASVDSNTNQIATTAFVIAQGYAKESAASATYAPVANPVFTGTVTLAQDPTQPLHAATKQYVDETAQGLIIKPAVEIATTANLTATYNNGSSGVGATLTATSNGAFPEIDGVTLSSTTPGQNGVLVKNQTNPAHNGRYNLTQVGDSSNPWILTRCGLCDSPTEIPGMYAFVKDGDVNVSTGWVAIVDDPSTFVVGTGAINFIQFSGAGTYTAGTGLLLTGSVFSNTGVLSVNGSTGAVTGIAPLQSPTFTGTPLSTTASVDTNTTQIATTAYVIGQAGSATPLVNGTAAVGTSTRYSRQDHVHGTDTTRAPLVSPTFTGVPAAPTASPDTNTTQIATTAFVIAQGYAKESSASATYAPVANPTFTGTLTAPIVLLTTADTSSAATHYMVETGTDGIIRPKTLANVRTEIVTTSAVNSASATTVGTITSGVWQGSSISTTYTDAKVTSVNGSTGAITGLATTAGKLNQFASTTSSELASVISNETGSGSLVFATSPTLVTPNIGVATGTSFNGITGLSSTNPTMNGSVAVGTGTSVARADHVHPTDTSRAPLASPTFTGTVTVATLDLTTAATATAATSYWVETGSDGIVRPKTLANVRTEIVTNAAVNAAAATTVGTVTSGTWAATDIGLAHGGTNASLTAANGAVVYSTSSALALTGVGTAGQVLTSNGAGAPTWQTPSGGGGGTGLESASATITANDTDTTIVSFSASANSSAEMFVQQKQGTKMTTSKFLVMWDGTDVNITEFAIMDAAAGAANTTITASHSGGTISVTASSPDAATTNVIIKSTVNYIAA